MRGIGRGIIISTSNSRPKLRAVRDLSFVSRCLCCVIETLWIAVFCGQHIAEKDSCCKGNASSQSTKQVVSHASLQLWP
jgi:hypothetical protein